MQSSTRKTVTRVSALILVLMLLLSFTASLAASFSKSSCGVKYGGSKFKLGSTTSGSKLKKAFGKYKRSSSVCTEGTYYEYKFSKKGIVIETLKKNGSSKEKIVTITIKEKTIPTVDGLKVGYKLSKFGDKYGTKCQKSGSIYRYKSGKYFMYLHTQKKKVTKIVFLQE